MKISALVFSALTCAVSARGNEQRILATLAEKWNLTEPSFTYDANTFNLTFPVTDFIQTGMARFSLWTAPGCQLDGDPLAINSPVWDSPPTLLENQALKTGSSTDSGDFAGRNATVVAGFDPQTITESDIYTDTSSNGQASAEIRFCIRFGLWTPNATPVEVNFLETLVTLTVDLTDGFSIDAINVEPKDRLVRTANQAYEVRGYECSETNFNELTTSEKNRARNQGEIIHVCVTPEQEAIDDGIFMRSVDEFTFTRDTTISQEAINNNRAAGNLLTTYNHLDCEGTLVCRFSTILFAQFYAEPGTVSGLGTASMQFGNTKTGQTRRQLLRSENEQRDLQEAAPEGAGSAEFDLNFEVAQGESQKESGAGSTWMGVATTTCAAVTMAAFL